MGAGKLSRAGTRKRRVKLSVKEKISVPALLKTAALSGLGFGLCISIVHLIVGIALILTLGMPPLTWFAGKTLFIETPLVTLAGLVLFPVFLSRKGWLLHPVLLTVIWILLELWVAVDPAKPLMWAAPSVVALLAFFAFRWVWSKKRWIVVAVCLVTPVVTLAVPVISQKVSGGYEVTAPDGGIEAPEGAPDVVFIVMDTVRAQSVSAYGYERKTTPKFDVFADKGVLFEQATAPSTWSLPAHASLFTGALPSVHNGHAETRFLDNKMPTLAETLAMAGWETRCFTANPHITPHFGLTRGFGWSDNAWMSGAGGRGFTFIYRLIDSLGVTAQDKGGARVVSNVQSWMSQRKKDGPPAFVFVNFLEAHFPFHQLPPEYRNAYTNEPLSDLRTYGQLAFGAQMGRQLTEKQYNDIHQPILDLYDGGILYTDFLVDQIIDTWRQRGILENTIVVILGDHGEHVGEHGAFGHLSSVYEQDLWVPLMIYYPPKIEGGKRVAQEVSTMGLFATIFDLIGLRAPSTLMVGSLMPAVEPEIPGRQRPAFGRPVMAERFEEHLLSERFEPGTSNGKGPLLSPWGRYRTYRRGDFKLVHHYAKGKFKTYLFNLKDDPEEMNDLAPSQPDKVAEIEREVKNWQTQLNIPDLDGKVPEVQRGGSSGMSDQVQEQLEALGYIETEGESK